MGLKEATAELHSKAEKMEFNQRMFRGELSTDEYANYLHQQLNEINYDLILYFYLMLWNYLFLQHLKQTKMNFY